jgi:hypothetical protein
MYSTDFVKKNLISQGLMKSKTVMVRLGGKITAFGFENQIIFCVGI